MNVRERVAARYRLFLSMSMGEALETLGFEPSDEPSKTEISQAYKTMAFENHPDRGGDATKMVEINVAKDILEGKERPSGGGGGGYGGPQTYRTTPVKKSPDIIVDFKEALGKAGVPGGVEWLFVTTSHYSGYNSDEFTNRSVGWVAVGQTDGAWVYVAAENHWKDAYFVGNTEGKTDVWYIRSFTEPKGQLVTARLLYGGVMKMWKSFKHLKKRFNSKVIEAKGWKLSEKLPTGRSLSIKNYLFNSGLMDKSEAKRPRKYIIEINYKRGPYGEKNPSGYFQPQYGDAFTLVLIISGKDYDMTPAQVAKLMKARAGSKDFMEWVFGRYYYGGETKVLTRKRGFKPVLKWMVENLPGLPPWVSEALTMAST